MILVAFVAIPAANAQGYNMYFARNTKVYASPSTKSASLSVPKGMNVVMTATSGGWAQVTNAGITAYCAMADLNLQSSLHGYLNTQMPVYAEASTSSLHTTSLPVNTDLYVVGIVGDFYRVQNTPKGGVTAYIPMKYVSSSRVVVGPQVGMDSLTKSQKQSVIAPNWHQGGSDVWKRKQYGVLYDILSKTKINIYRMGGTEHADVEPVTAEDTAKLLAICGGQFSWNSRPCILIANGYYIACAINTMPHGDQTIKNNNYNGQFCLHFVGSKTHGTEVTNQLHQQAIVYAYQWAHS